MFTGIVSDVGRIVENSGVEQRNLVIATGYDVATIDIGASIACNGACLTVIAKAPGIFTVQASGETLDKTTLGAWTVGARINLERALRFGDELGGHLVAGHVDGVATILSIKPDGDSVRFVFDAPKDLARFIAPKGSVAIDGVSLTVNEVEGTRFGVNIIPHTQQVTIFGSYREGTRVNLEIDLLARYVARFLATQ
jgi:riboflavin synthase